MFGVDRVGSSDAWPLTARLAEQDDDAGEREILLAVLDELLGEQGLAAMLRPGSVVIASASDRSPSRVRGSIPHA